MLKVLKIEGASINMDENVGVEIITKGKSGIITFQTASICDVDEITAISGQIKAFIIENKPSCLVFDFERVKFFSSQLLGLLIDIRNCIIAYDGEVVISAINPQLHRVFRITNLDKIFRFFPNRESAIKAIDQDS
jgi:anti-sigma B factor antagonist